MSKKILVINCGSSSLKYQLYLMPEGKNIVKGNVERIGEDVAFLTQKRVADKKEMMIKAQDLPGGIKNHTTAFKEVVKCLLDKDSGILKDINEIDIVAHRIVQGGDRYSDAAVIDPKVIIDIEELSDLAPLHNPAHLQGIKAATEALPKVTQTVTFDTAFHQTIPAYAYMYAIPYDLYKKFGIRKYGAHGTSHKYVSERAAEFLGRKKDDFRCIVCHLGNGASVTAVQNGKSVDTSMGLTPLEGLVMGTRCGDIDATVVPYLYHKGYSVDDINTILQKKSGLLGIFEKTNDMRDVIAADKAGDERGQLALNLWAHRVKKYIGAYYASLDRVDAVIFTGGIGENSPYVRERILKGLDHMGLVLDKSLNDKTIGDDGVISKNGSPVTIAVIPTNEEFQIASDAFRIVK